MSEKLEKRIGLRLTEADHRQLERDAGGPSKVSAYLRGLIRGARTISENQKQAA